VISIQKLTDTLETAGFGVKMRVECKILRHFLTDVNGRVIFKWDGVHDIQLYLLRSKKLSFLAKTKNSFCANKHKIFRERKRNFI